MEEPRGKRPRRPKFTVVEMLAMVRSVAGKHDILFGKFTFDSASTVVRMKAASWQYVIDAVNATNPDGLQAPLPPTQQIVFPPPPASRNESPGSRFSSHQASTTSIH